MSDKEHSTDPPDKEATLPDQKELEKEIGDYLSRKYGDRVKIVSTGLFPQTDPAKHHEPQTVPEKSPIPRFDMKPEELVAYLDEYVIRQDLAKAVLATKICTHFNRIRYLAEHQMEGRRDIGRIKNNVLLIGPTGVGKTYLIKLIAQKIGVPFVKGDATKFSETGYVGGDVEDLIRDLVREADNDIEQAQYGIIYLDEVDKIARSPNRIGADVSRSGVQRALLKPMEETEVEMKTPHDIISQIEAMEHYRSTGKRGRQVVNTKNILFIMSGAFEQLEEIIRKRCRARTIGFAGTIKSAADSGRLLKEVKAEDLVNFGFESEFIGRLPVLAVLEELSEDDFYDILLSPNCPVVLAKKQDFKIYGIELAFTDEALREIARLAVMEKTGARGLVSVVEKALLPFEKRLPSTEVTALLVEKDLIREPNRVLDELLKNRGAQENHVQGCAARAAMELQRLTDFFQDSRSDYLRKRQVDPTETKLAQMAQLCQSRNMEPDEVCEFFIDMVCHIREWEARISEKCGMRVVFQEESMDAIIALRLNRDDIDRLCTHLLEAMEYGLRLLNREKGVPEVQLPPKAVENPEQYINELVEKSFKV